MRPGERGGRSGLSGVRVDPLRQEPKRSRGAVQGDEQAQRGAPAAPPGCGGPPVLPRERREPPGGPGGRRRPRILAAAPALGGHDPEPPSVGRDSQQGSPRRRVERLDSERPHGPGGSRVEPGAGVVGDADQPSTRTERGAERRRPGPGKCGKRGDRDRVAEVVAGIALLVVGAVSPARPARSRIAQPMRGRGLPSVPPRAPRRRRHGTDARRPRGRRDPARGVALGRAHGDRLAGSPEPCRGLEVEAEQEAGSAPRLGPIARGGEGDRGGGRVARPDVRPALPRTRDDGAGARVGQRPQDEQRTPVHPARPSGRPTAQRPSPRQPAPVPAPVVPAHERRKDPGEAARQRRIGRCVAREGKRGDEHRRSESDACAGPGHVPIQPASRAVGR